MRRLLLAVVIAVSLFGCSDLETVKEMNSGLFKGHIFVKDKSRK